MDYLRFAYLHLATVVPAFVLGTIIMFRRKGTPQHKLIGRVYMALMATTAILTLFMKAQVGPTLFGHFGYIHLLSLLTIWTVPAALIAAHRAQRHGGPTLIGHFHSHPTGLEIGRAHV